jgi:pilus assembly protein Flp/PilA
MNNMMKFVKTEDGVTSVEYGLLGMLIFVVMIGAVALLGTRLTELFNRIAAEVGRAIGG